MYSESIDFGDELDRHEQLFGREDVLTRLLGWLDGDQRLPRGWVLLLGSPGVGKSAILTRTLGKLQAQPAASGGEPLLPPHHFLRRGVGGWDRPEVVVQNLCAQLEKRYPERSDAALPPGARISDLLTRLSKNVLRPRGERLILVLDGLDEAVSDGSGENPLPRFLPEALPAGVVILCTSRPIHPYMHWLLQRDNVHTLDLDDMAWSASNEAACRDFWEHQITRFTPPLDRALVDEAVRCAGGNLLHASRLRDWLWSQPPEQRVATNIPLGLSSFLEQIWARLLDDTHRHLAVQGLGLACAAREALPAYLFGELLGWSTTSEYEDFLRATRPFLLARWHAGQTVYRPYHDYFREFVADKLGEPKMREYHRLLARTLAASPPDERESLQGRYALRYAVVHRLVAGDVPAARSLCTDVGYLEAKHRALNIAAIEQDLEATVRASEGDGSLELRAVSAAISAEADHLREDPAALPGLLYNRLRCAGWQPERIERVLRWPAGLPRLRLKHRVRLGTTLLRTFLGHDKQVVACSVTPDGRHVLSASADRTLRLWALGSGDCLATLSGHQDEITGCALTSDGATAISTSTDATVRIWDLRARCCVGTVENEGRWPTACAVIPDGQRFVVGSDDGSLHIWDRASLQRSASLEGHTDYVTAVAVTSRGKRLVSASRDGSVRVWDLASRACVYTLRRTRPGPGLAPRGMDEQQWITALATTPDGRYAVAAAGDGSLVRWDLASGVARSLGAQHGRIDTCTITPDGVYLLCGLADGTILVWNLAAFRCIGQFNEHAGAVSACAATPDGRRIVSASHDRSLKLWDLGAPESLAPQERHAAPVTACAVSRDGALAVSASEDRTLRVWDLEAGICRVTLEGHEDLVTACAVSPDGQRVVSGARDGSLRIWSVESSKPRGVLQGHEDRVSGCAFLSEDQLLTTSYDRTVRLWNLATQQCIATLGVHEDAVVGCAVTPNGAHALSVGRDGAVKLWDVAARTSKPWNGDPGGGLLCGDLTPDARRAVLAHEDGVLEVRDLRSGQVGNPLRAHGARVLGCAVSPDGARVVSASEDATLKVWCLSTGELLGTLHGTRRFRCVTATNELICAGDEDGNLWMVVADLAKTCWGRLPRDAIRPPFPPAQPNSEEQELATLVQGILDDSRRGRTSTPFGFSVYSLTAGLAPLRDVFARLYHTAEEARIIAQDANLDLTRLWLGGNPQVFWQAILDEAERKRRLPAVVVRAYKEYPDEISDVVRKLSRR